MSSAPFFAIMQPSAGFGCPYKKAAKAFYRPTARGVDRIELEQGTTSTPRTFNMLLCDALNYKGERPITRLAMCHDDVAPDGPWLDILDDELERTGAFMVSAVVPIRDDKGMVSTAVDMGDPWLTRRLTMHEVFNLPETFAASDIPWNTHGGALLPNTGLWVARFDRAVWEAFGDSERWGDGQSGFRFHNRIVKMPDGEWTSQDIAEDWSMGRVLASLGQKVVVTRKAALEHGHPRYHTRSVWGQWPTDLGYLEYQRKLSLANNVPEGWRFPKEVNGWLTEVEGMRLGELAKDRTVLEIGCYCGRSTICMAQGAKSVVAVDPFDGRATTAARDTFAEFVGNLVSYGVIGKITTYRGTSEMVVPDLADTFDLVFIDGNHTQEAVRRDAEMARRKLTPSGVVAFHDYGRVGDEGVTAAVDSLIKDGAKLLDVCETVAVLSLAV